MIDLLEFSEAIGVEIAIPSQDVQLAEQRLRLAGQKLPCNPGTFHSFAQAGPFIAPAVAIVNDTVGETMYQSVVNPIDSLGGLNANTVKP